VEKFQKHLEKMDIYELKTRFAEKDGFDMQNP
jgi:hypothetical protein